MNDCPNCHRGPILNGETACPDCETAIKRCEWCTRWLYQSDPDLCERCDEHQHDISEWVTA